MIDLAVSGNIGTAANAVAVMFSESHAERPGRRDESPAVLRSQIARLIDLIVPPVHISTEPIRLGIFNRSGITVNIQFEQELVAEIGFGTVERQIFVALATVHPGFGIL